MLEIMILLPLDGVPTAYRAQIEEQAARTYGGYSWVGRILGGWTSPEGEHVQDASAVLSVAVDSLADLSRVLRSAASWGRLLGQHSVYVRLPAAGWAECVECDGRET